MPGEPREKALFGVDGDDVEVQDVAERCQHAARLRRWRIRPLSTKMQVSCLPIARATSVAATAESTPPESAQITLRVADLAREFVRSRRRRTTPSVHVGRDLPRSGGGSSRGSRCRASVCTTSGWNCTPKIPARGVADRRDRRASACGRRPRSRAAAPSPCRRATSRRATRAGRRGTAAQSARIDGQRRRTELGVRRSGTSFPPSFFATSCIP